MSETDKQSAIRVEVLQKQLDEEVARYKVEGFDGAIAQLTQQQAAYIHVNVDGPFKSDEYKY